MTRQFFDRPIKSPLSPLFYTNISFLYDYKMITRHILVSGKFTAISVIESYIPGNDSESEKKICQEFPESRRALMPFYIWDTITFGQIIYRSVWFHKETQKHSVLRSAHARGLVPSTSCKENSPEEFTRWDYVEGTNPLWCLHGGTNFGDKSL